MASIDTILKQFYIIEERLNQLNFELKQVHPESMNDIIRERDDLIKLKETILNAEIVSSLDIYAMYGRLNPNPPSTPTIPLAKINVNQLPIVNYNANVIFYIDQSFATIPKLKSGTVLYNKIKEMVTIWQNQIYANSQLMGSTPVNLTYSLVQFNNFFAYPSNYALQRVTKSNDLTSIMGQFDYIPAVFFSDNSNSFIRTCDGTIDNVMQTGAVNTIFYISAIPFYPFDYPTDFNKLKTKLNGYNSGNTKMRLYALYPKNKTPNMLTDFPFFDINNVKDFYSDNVDLRQWAYNVLGV